MEQARVCRSTEHMELAHKEWTAHTEGNPSRNWLAHVTGARAPTISARCSQDTGCDSESVNGRNQTCLWAVACGLWGCSCGRLQAVLQGSRGTHMVAHLTCAEHGERLRLVRAAHEPSSFKQSCRQAYACLRVPRLEISPFSRRWLT